jgi:hypothetical protein
MVLTIPAEYLVTFSYDIIKTEITTISFASRFRNIETIILSIAVVIIP